MSMRDYMVEEEIELLERTVEKRNQTIATLKKENEMLARNYGRLRGLNGRTFRTDRRMEDQQEKPPLNDYVERQALKDTVSRVEDHAKSLQREVNDLRKVVDGESPDNLLKPAPY